jgi:FK506-binding protein 2
MRAFLLSLSFLFVGAVNFVAAEEPLKIQVTYAVECERKTKKGDIISVHYRGNLTTGEEFDNNT